MNLSSIDHVIEELLHRYWEEKTHPSEGFREPMLAMGPEGGKLIETIVFSTKPRRGLEIGTSSGFSALYALRGALKARCEFHLWTIDHDPAKARWAEENFRKAGVDQHITLLIKDGLQAARELEGPWDYVLLDAAKWQNLPLMENLIPKLNPGAVVVTDNVLTHQKELQEFTQFVRNHPQLISSMFALGNGIEVTFKVPE
ncbi:MAG: O-methyltransferase [bacterium]